MVARAPTTAARSGAVTAAPARRPPALGPPALGPPARAARRRAATGPRAVAPPAAPPCATPPHATPWPRHGGRGTVAAAHLVRGVRRQGGPRRDVEEQRDALGPA